MKLCNECERRIKFSVERGELQKLGAFWCAHNQVSALYRCKDGALEICETPATREKFMQQVAKINDHLNQAAAQKH